jgi:hypothetical protein
MRTRIVAAIAMALVPALLGGQTASTTPKEGDKPVPSFNLKPSVLDAKDGSGTVLGAEYDFGIDWKYALATDRGSSTINPDAPIFRVGLTGSADGTVAVDKRRNPKNFSEGKVELSLLRSTSAFSFSIGAKTKFETDQSFQNKAFVLGGSGTGMVCWALTQAGCIVAYVSYDNVDPKNDKERTAVLGPNPSSFKRVNLELLFKQELQWNAIRGLEVNYRLFQELDAPAAVESAKIASFALTTVRVDLPSEFFVAYSTGKLPFDRKDDQIVQLGWSYKLW